jgi:hypothetical protein
VVSEYAGWQVREGEAVWFEGVLLGDGMFLQRLVAVLLAVSVWQVRKGVWLSVLLW